MRPRRVIVQAFACCPPGRLGFEGGEDLLGWMLVCQLAKFAEVWVITHPWRRQGIEEALRQAPMERVHFEYVGLLARCDPWLRTPGLHQLYYYLWQAAAWWRARKLHHALHFDLAHHLTYANDWMASFIGALLPVPYLRGPGGGAHRVPTPLLEEFSLMGRVGEWWRSLGQRLFRLDPMFLLGQHRAQALLLCGREALEAVPHRWRRKAECFPVNGISEDDLRFLSEPVPRRSGRLQVLSAGKLLRLKGFPLAIKAFGAFLNGHPEAEFEIIGDGPDRPWLRQLIHTLGLERRVRLRSWVPRLEFLGALRRCDVFLFPSLRDGGGAVVIEAMAAGKPVVCLSTGGPDLHIQEGCGIKVSARTSEQVVADLAAALARLYDDAPLRETMGQAARRRAEQLYRWDALGERLHQHYEVILGASGSTEERVLEREADGLIRSASVT